MWMDQELDNRANKYLRMKGEVTLEIDQYKFDIDDEWDGLKGYVANSKHTKSKLLNWMINRLNYTISP
jgi:hypothetical protein